MKFMRILQIILTVVAMIIGFICGYHFGHEFCKAGFCQGVKPPTENGAVESSTVNGVCTTTDSKNWMQPNHPGLPTSGGHSVVVQYPCGHPEKNVCIANCNPVEVEGVE